MNETLNVLQIIFYSIGILFMLVFMIIGIWSFVIYNKMYRSKRVENYILEKMYQTMSKSPSNNASQEVAFDINSLLEDDNLFGVDTTNEEV
ncbi:MAG: hypothetical protein RR620_13555 [Clostridium sp.]